jgi:hypothetical protein
MRNQLGWVAPQPVRRTRAKSVVAAGATAVKICQPVNQRSALAADNLGDSRVRASARQTIAARDTRCTLPPLRAVLARS